MTKSAKRKAHDLQKAQRGEKLAYAEAVRGPMGLKYGFPVKKPYAYASVFGATGAELESLMPLESRANESKPGTYAVEFIRNWFFNGVSDKEYARLRPKPFIETDLALKHISAIIRSFEPSHERKMQACAYLIEMWFEPLAEPDGPSETSE